MQTFLLVIHCVITLALVGMILIQKSDGAGMALSGQWGDLVSARGAANLLTRLTAILATLFMVNCLVLAYIAVRSNQHKSILSYSDPRASTLAPLIRAHS